MAIRAEIVRSTAFVVESPPAPVFGMPGVVGPVVPGVVVVLVLLLVIVLVGVSVVLLSVVCASAMAAPLASSEVVITAPPAALAICRRVIMC
jgi:hypothetical protein